MNPAERGSSNQSYLLLADISGYTSFLHGVERVHVVDLSGVMPAGYETIGRLLGTVIDGVQPTFEIEKVEGDAVFAVARAELVDGRGMDLLAQLQSIHDAFVRVRTTAIDSTDHVCTACPVVANLDLKYVVHRGNATRVGMGTHAELHGPAVILAHRLLKNGVTARIGSSPYVLVTEAAADGLGLSGMGLAHTENYSEVGAVSGEIFELARGLQAPVT